MAALTEREQQRMALLQHWQDDLMGYLQLQGTRPQAIAYALADSRWASWPGSSRISRTGPTRRPSSSRTP